jgi:DNA-directed RNA polymerase subunit RPC12/RpoP
MSNIMTKYICINCLHEWNSNNVRKVLRCSNCHRMQGVNYEIFRKAVDSVKKGLNKISKSPPPHRPPLEVLTCIPAAIEPVLYIAKKEFPSPLVPISTLVQILKCATEELQSQSSQDEQGVDK